jgi:uncharacterized repeat protein (TIGR01451 family)
LFLRLFLAGAGILSLIAIVPGDSKLWAADGAALILSNSAIDEHQAAGTLVGTFRYTGQDLADAADYTLVSGEGDAGNDHFFIEGNTLKTAAVFDFETQNAYSIRVRREGIIASAEEIFIIAIGDVSEDIAPENVPPVITEGESLTADMKISDSRPLTISLNAADPDSDSLKWEIVTPAAHGPANITGPKTGDAVRITYNPTANYHGADSFTVQVSDGELTDAIVIYINIIKENSPPVIAEGESAGVYMDQNAAPTAFSLTLNASDSDEDELTWQVVTPPEHGTAQAAGIGNIMPIVYMPENNYHGTDRFTVQVSDGQLTDVITVNVYIRPKSEEACEAVCAQADKCGKVYMDEDGSPQDFSLTLNARDPDDDVLTWSISVPALYGAAFAEGTGYTKAIAYTPHADYNGTDSFEVQVSDGQLSDSITICVSIRPQNDAPKFVPVNAPNATQHQPYMLTAAASDPDAGDMLVIKASELPNWLALTDNGDGTAALTGMPETAGDYRVQIEVRDAYGETASQSFVIQVASAPENNDSHSNVSENNENAAEENTAKETETEAPAPVITVTQTDHSDPVQPGELLTYIISYTNAGSVPASNLVITETYDENVSFVSANPAPDPGTDHQWTLASLSPGDSGTITVTVLVKSPLHQNLIRNSVTADIHEETVVSQEDTGVFNTVFGDVDESGAVDLRDAVFTLQMLCGLATPPVFVSGDVNGDKRIGTEEAVYILQSVSELR